MRFTGRIPNDMARPVGAAEVRADIQLGRVVTTAEAERALIDFRTRIGETIQKINTELLKFDPLIDKDVFDLTDLFALLGAIKSMGLQLDELDNLLDDYQNYYLTYGQNTSTPFNVSADIQNIKAWIEQSRHSLATAHNTISKGFSDKHASRIELDVNNAIDWDKDPTVYQATTISHGHVLYYRSHWKANGYSLGE